MIESILAMLSAIAPLYFTVMGALVLGLAIGFAIGTICWPQTTDEFAIKMLKDFE